MGNDLKKTAKLTGVLYLLVIICAGFAQGYARGTLIIPNDASSTINNILNSEGLFRLGLVADLIAFMLDVVISVLLYQMLKGTNKTLAMVSSAFRLIAHPAIASVNLVNHYMALKVAKMGFPSEDAAALVMTYINAHTTGYLVAGAFFGVHCLFLAFLLYKSVNFPKWLGVLMIIASLGYFIETFGNFLMPGYEMFLATVVGFSAALGEVTFTVYLLVNGIKSSRKLK